MLKHNTDFPHVVLVGHPFAPIGRGEDVRSAFRAFRAAGVSAPVLDIYKMYEPWSEFSDSLTTSLSQDINIFFINGDEVEPVIKHLGGSLPAGSYNIVAPVWELSIYPEAWAKQLERFDEIWVASTFNLHSIQSCVSKPVHYIPWSSQVDIVSFLGRQYFGIPEGAYIFLFAFDFLSSIHRKNPYAVLKAFEKLVRAHPQHDSYLVLKLNHSQQKPEEYQHFLSCIEEFKDRIVIIDKTLSDNEMKNLIRCSDCFISLHRSEGFGRGLSEAMYLGKPTIATGYSGNTDFMSSENSFLVNYQLVPVETDAYPYGENQFWSEANIDQAFNYMLKLLSNPKLGFNIGKKASKNVRKTLSYSTIGEKYREYITHINKNMNSVS